MARYGSSDDSGIPGDDPTRATRYSEGGAQSPGPTPAPFGPPGQGYQPGNAPTQYDNYSELGQQPAPDPAVPADFGGSPPTPWFRRRPVLIAWIALIVGMIAVVIWGIIQLTSRGPGTTTTPSTTSSTTTTSTTTTTTSTSTTATTTVSRAAPPQPAPPQQSPAPRGPADEPPHRHHLPELPSVITIPPVPRAPELPTVITVPPRFR